MKILILGGGISGLSAAWLLGKKYPSAQITLLEKSDRLGGSIRTMRKEGYLFEQGPRTFQTEKSPHLLRLIHELKLDQELIYSTPSKRYLYSKGRLRSPFFATHLPWFFREPFIPKADLEDESIYDFASRRFSSQIAEELFDPLTLGIYAGDIKKLSIRSCFPKIFEWEQTKGSVLKGMLLAAKLRGGLFTLRSGMSALIDALQKQIRAKIVLNCPVERIERNGVFAGNTLWHADKIFSALPTPFPKKSIWVINLLFQNPVLPKRGFGYLVPSQEKERILGMIWDSSVFPQQNQRNETRLTVMQNEADVEISLEAARRHLGIQEKPLFTTSFYAKETIPQFEVGYFRKIATYSQENPHLTLLGNYLGGISVEACIARCVQTVGLSV